MLRRSLIWCALLFPALAVGLRAGDDTPPASAPSGVKGLRFLDLDGAVHRLGGRSDDRFSVILFVGNECPISNRSIPKLNRLVEELAGKPVDIFGVVPDAAITRADLVKHRDTYKLAFPVFLDPTQLLQRRLKPTHMPEAFLLDPAGLVLYRGAIDDGWARIGKPRAQVKERYLARAIEAALAGKPVPEVKTQAIGCALNPIDEKLKVEEVTYTRHIAPLMALHCIECHRPGEVAPFSLTSYRDVAKRAQFISAITGDRIMPPWQPAGHGAFLDERRMSDEELALIDAWASKGAPLGDKADLPPTPVFDKNWRLGKPDLVLSMADSYPVKAEGSDDFRCFVIPTGLTEDKDVVAFEYHPGAPTVVHHAIFYLDDQGQGRDRDARSEGQGYPGFGGIGFAPYGALGGYAPGAQPMFLPKGVARFVKKGTDIIMQVHYHSSGKAERDLGSIALYFAKKPVKKHLQGLVMGTQNINIPAGEKRYMRHVYMDLNKPIDLYGIAPHMHYLGKEARIWATYPNGRQRDLIWIQNWDFRWQGQYFYRQPVRLPAGTRISMTTIHDNSTANSDNPSDPPRRVRFGDESTDEMSFGFLTITTDEPSDMRALRMAMVQGFIRSRSEAEHKESPEKLGPVNKAPEKKAPAKKPLAKPAKKPAKKKTFY